MLPLLEFDRATVARSGVPALRDLTWRVFDGQAWAIVGPNGSGKTTLAEAVAGRHRIVSGEFRSRLASVRLLPFGEDSRLFRPQHFYYQQRFEFSEPDDCPTVRQYLAAGRTVTESDFARVCDRLRIGALLGLTLLKLSNGQTRRVRLARGLLAAPDLLVLDDPYSGLDVQGRGELDDTLAELVRGGQRLMIATRADQVPGWVTDVLGLNPAVTSRDREGAVADPARRATAPSRSRLVDAGAILALNNVSVRHGGSVILDRITWTVRAGERWAVVGPNGSGKTTLLSLVCGDHPQAFANDVSLFGRYRGPGESVWEVKRRVGLVSPELHQYFPRMRTALDAAATGFHDVLSLRPISDEQAATLAALFARFGLTDSARRPWWQLSTGAQRAVLFVRAVVKRPELLVLDEPFQAMDGERVNLLRDWLDTELAADQTLLMVTHRPEELPACVTRRLRLDAGRVAELSEWATNP